MRLTLKHVLLLLITPLLFISCDSCPTGDPENTITEEQAVDMKNRFLEMDQGAGNDDFTDVTFNLEDVQKYLHKMSKLGSDEGYEKLGLRVHFARTEVNGTPKRTVFFETVAPIAETDNKDLSPLYKWKTMHATSFYNMGDGGNNKVPDSTGGR